MLTRRQALLAATATALIGLAGADTARAADAVIKIGIDLSLTGADSQGAGRVKNAIIMAVDAANEAEEAIRRNPLSAVAIAVGLGFLFGVFTRR